MHVFIELWSQKPSWATVPRDRREALMSHLGELTRSTGLGLC
jgi:hypothetical protein